MNKYFTCSVRITFRVVNEKTTYLCFNEQISCSKTVDAIGHDLAKITISNKHLFNGSQDYFVKTIKNSKLSKKKKKYNSRFE